MVTIHGGFPELHHLPIWPPYFHTVHSVVLAQTEVHCIWVLRAVGIARHNLPNCAAPVIVERHPNTGR